MYRKNKPLSTVLARAGIAVLSCALWLSGCGTAPKQQNARMQLAIQSNQLGESAFYGGDYARARAYFEEALRIDESIENIDGMAINRINLARTCIAMGDDAQAQQHLDALLRNPRVTYPAAQLTLAATLASTLSLKSSDLQNATAMLDKGQAWCGSNCTALPSLLLLRAQIALRAERPDEAIEQASSVLRRLDGSQTAEEKANALRVVGEAWMAKKNPAESIARFEQALALDREAGVPQKISLDLMYLGQASKMMNKPAEANAYFRRAAAVRTAAGDKVGADIALRNLESKE
jgi:tetratricopeptide (TPR) repeat protein